MNEESKYLGRRVRMYPKSYNPALLVAVPRYRERQKLDIRKPLLFFKGFDTWHAYEVSFLLPNGCPVVGMLKIVYPADSPFIVESKSLKLYLNSFNMHVMHKGSYGESIGMFECRVRDDLEELLHTRVNVKFFPVDRIEKGFDFSKYKMADLPGDWIDDVDFAHYNENPELLTLFAYEVDEDERKLVSHFGTNLLRSNCRVTGQPDWGSVYVYMNGKRYPTPESFLLYIVSLRNEYHFHEEICELIYKRMWDAFNPKELAVTCIYTRRGGIDICPSRVSHERLLPPLLGNVNAWSEKLPRQ